MEDTLRESVMGWSVRRGGGIASTRSETDSLREIRTLPNHVADREPRGGGCLIV